MSELRHECGLAAVYHLAGGKPSGLCPAQGPGEVSRLLPRMLLDIQTRGQLSAGMTVYRPHHRKLLTTHKDVGSVGDVFRISHRAKYERLMKSLAGPAAIGHVRYATCGDDDRNYAQPLERPDLQKHRWFSLGYNGQLANYVELRRELLADGNSHLTCENDTEIIAHHVCRELSREGRRGFGGSVSQRDGQIRRGLQSGISQRAGRDGGAPRSAGHSSAMLRQRRRAVRRGQRKRGAGKHGLPGGKHSFAVAGANGHRRPRAIRAAQFRRSSRRAHCFFEWIYFANMASTLDERNVYLARQRLGEELARLETMPLDEHTIIVPVPETSKAAADAMAFRLRVPAVEGLIRNRYTGRTFIEGNDSRRRSAETKYTPVREVLQGKRVLLVEDSIVRSTTMRVLIHRLRELGGVREIHVRVACPPIIAPCFYGIDMSTVGELFAPPFLHGGQLTEESQVEMARRSGPIHCAICRWNRSPAPSASTPINSARRAPPASIPRPAARSCIKLRYRRRMLPAAAARMNLRLSADEAAGSKLSTAKVVSSTTITDISCGPIGRQDNFLFCGFVSNRYDKLCAARGQPSSLTQH